MLTSRVSIAHIHTLKVCTVQYLFKVSATVNSNFNKYLFVCQILKIGTVWNLFKMNIVGSWERIEGDNLLFEVIIVILACIILEICYIYVKGIFQFNMCGFVEIKLYNKFMENKVTIDTDTFKLIATLEEGKLTISLWDLEDVVAYARQYTDKDIGGQINRKAELSYLFDVLTESLSHPDSQEYQQYTYNQIHTINDIQYYKLQKGGILSIYTPWMDMKNQKTIYIQSDLHLDVDGNVKKEEMEVEITKRQLAWEKERKGKKDDNFESFRKEMKKQIKKQMREIKNQIKQLLQQIQTPQSTLHPETDIEKQKQRIDPLSSPCKPDQHSQQPESQSQFKQKQRLKQPFSLQYLTKLIHQPNQSTFLIVNNMIEHIGQNGGWQQFIFNAFIPYKNVYVFKIKCVRSVNAGGICMMVGVVDYEKQKAAKYSYNSKNAILYFSSGGKGYTYNSTDQSKEIGIGYKTGETVEVAVSRSQKKINWSVQGEVRATVSDQILADQSRMFLPYIEISYKGDIVELIQF